MNEESLAKRARAVERDIFGALIGALGGVVVGRLVLLVTQLHPFTLAALLLIGSWTGAFVAHLATNRSSRAMESIRSLAAVFRSVCLRLILWMLGAAAVLGVLSVLTGTFEVVGRVAATAAVTGIAAAALFPLLSCLDEDKKWRVGVLGTASVFAAYFLGLPSIWEIGYRASESALAGLVIALMMPVGLVAMQFTHEQSTRFAGWVAALLYAAALSMFLIAIWDNQWNNEERLMATGFFLLGFGSLAIAALINAFTGDGRNWRWLGVGFAIAAAAVGIYATWTRINIDAAWLITLGSVAVVVAHANISMLAPLTGGQIWWRYGTIAAAIITAGAVDIESWFNNGVNELTMVGRIALAAAIVTSTGSLAMLIFTRLNYRVPPSTVATSGPMTHIALHCPRCGKPHTIRLLETFQCDCGVQINVRVDDALPT